MKRDTKAFWQVVQEAHRRRFSWGEHDCVTFAMRCAVAISGDKTLESRVRVAFGTWGDALEATRAIGQDGLTPAISSVLGAAVPWWQLRLGDLALVLDDEGREVVTVHDGVKLVAPDAIGLRSVPVERALHGWRVG